MNSRWTRIATWLVLVLAAFGPLLREHFGRLWVREHYQYFPLLMVVIVYLGWSRWDEAPAGSSSVPKRRLAAALGGLAVFVLTVAVLYQAPTIAAVGAIFGMGVIGLHLHSHRQMKNLLGIWCLLWLLIRVPMDYDQKLMTWLQLLTTHVSSRILDLVGLLHHAEGSILSLPAKTFFVDEACSGIISLMTMITACGVIIVHHNRALLHALCLMAAGVFWAGAMNVMRIVIIAGAYWKGEWDLTEGWAHDVTGLCVFLIGFLGLWCTDTLLQFVLEPMKYRVRFKKNPLRRLWNALTTFGGPALHARTVATDETEETPRETVTPGLCLRGVYWNGLAVVLLLLSALQLGVAYSWFRTAAPTVSREQLLESTRQLDQQSIQPADGWEVVRFKQEERSARSIWGANSLTWSYQQQDLTVLMSLDYWFYDWHELSDCYVYSGWERSSRNVVRSMAVDEGDWETVTTDFYRLSTGERGLLYFDLFNGDGMAQKAPSQSAWTTLTERFDVRKLAFWNAMSGRRVGEEVFQVQAFARSDAALSEGQRKQVQRAYKDFRTQIRRALAGGD